VPARRRKASAHWNALATPPPKCVAKGNRRHSLLLIIAGYFVRAAATFLFPGREMSASESRIFLDFRLFVARLRHAYRL
jgi:hypothetical protein